MRLTILALAASAAALSAAAPAQAVTYCVGDKTNCTGTAAATFEEALVKAKASTAVADKIHLGKGAYTTASGFVYNQSNDDANDLHIEGEGPQTILKADTASKSNGFKVLSLTGSGNLETFVSELKIESPTFSGGAPTAGLQLIDASAEYTTITGAAAYGAMLNFNGRMRFATITMDNGEDGALVSGTAAELEDTKITGSAGIEVTASGSLTAGRLDITSKTTGITCNECKGVSVDSTTLRIGLKGTGIHANAITGDAIVNASHLTVFGSITYTGRTATAIRTQSQGSGHGAVNVDNSVFFAITKAYDCVATGSGEADVTAFNNNYTANANDNVDIGPGQLSETARTSLTTGFVAPMSGDFHLGPKAAQIDKGRAVPFVAGLGVDVDLEDRTVGAPDQGADEYQKHAPFAMVDGPAKAMVGDTVALSGAKSGAGGDPGDSVTSYTWDFKDGTAKATGAQIEHAWTAPGSYQVILEITDKEGQVDTTMHQVVVSAPVAEPVVEPVVDPVVEATVEPTVEPSVQPAVQPPAEPAVPSSPGPAATPVADRTEPQLTGVRVSKRSFPRSAVTTLGWTVSEAGTLEITVRKGRKVLARTKRSVGSGIGTAGLKPLTRRLVPGRYVLAVTAVDAAGNRSAPARIKVRIRH